MPASRSPTQSCSSRLFGLASSVISASGLTQNESRHAWMSVATCAGDNMDGVPPPMKMESAVRPVNLDDQMFISRLSAST